MNVREEVGDFVQHLAWAFLGQECDCGHNPLNGLARWFAKPVFESYGDDDDMTPLNWQTATTYWVGSRLCDLALWIYTPPAAEFNKEENA
jgi:hypothetical protein